MLGKFIIGLSFCKFSNIKCKESNFFRFKRKGLLPTPLQSVLSESELVCEEKNGNFDMS